jgi:hypothetical protein
MGPNREGFFFNLQVFVIACRLLTIPQMAHFEEQLAPVTHGRQPTACN